MEPWGIMIFTAIHKKLHNAWVNTDYNLNFSCSRSRVEVRDTHIMLKFLPIILFLNSHNFTLLYFILLHYSYNYSTQTPKSTCINAKYWLKVWNCVVKRDCFLPTGGELACTRCFCPKSESSGACSLSRRLGYIREFNSCTLELLPRVWIVFTELLLHIGPLMSPPHWMWLLL